ERAQENRFLVAVGVVKAAALDAGCGGEILHGRVVETLAPEHVQRNRDHLLLVELTHAPHFRSLHPSIIASLVKLDILVKDRVLLPGTVAERSVQRADSSQRRAYA